MKQFLLVLKFELNNYFKNKSFVITTLLLALLVAGVVIVPTFIPGFLDDEADVSDPNSFEEIIGDDEEVELDRLGICIESEVADSDFDTITKLFEAEWSRFESEEVLHSAVEMGDIDAGFVMRSPTEITYVVNNSSMMDYLGESFSYTLSEYYKQQYLLEKGLTPEEIMESESIFVSMEQEILGKDSVSNYGYTYILVFVVYFLIIFYGQMIATAVTTEKSNRAIEILVTSVNPNSLICGKVLAGAIAGVVQAALILGSGFLSYNAVGEKWGGILDVLFDIPTNVLIAYAIFALFSYVLYAFIFGMLGALVSKTEDISKSSTPVLMIYITSFVIAMLGMTNPETLIMKIASFIPFTSGNAMFIRVSMGEVALWEVALSAIILVASCVVAGVLAAKIFRFGTLHYGNPMKLKTALKKAKE